MTEATERQVSLPRWVQAAFWSVVAAEWTATLLVSVMVLLAVIHLSVLVEVGCLPDTTVYASGYSDRRWADVQVGDTQTGVRASLGEPLHTWSRADDERWSYSKQGGATDNYRERTLRFALDGRLLEKQETCYID